jgi:hypothetical protein
MKVKFLNNFPKTIDGKPLGPFRKDEVRDIDEATAQLFIGSAMAEAYVEPVVEAAAEAPVVVETVAVAPEAEESPRRRRFTPAE